MSERVVVAMSGGVDSSVAAALLVEQGFEVIGVMLRLWSEADGDLQLRLNPHIRNPQGHIRNPPTAAARSRQSPTRRAWPTAWASRSTSSTSSSRSKSRWSISSWPSTRRAARRIPAWPATGRSASAICSTNARTLGARYLATGHYARVRRDAMGRYQLWRGVDRAKDQSYVLSVLGQADLDQVLFPAGEYTKPQVRALAAERGLPTASRVDSQDLCFVADGDYRRFLADHAPDAVQPGPIFDTRGRQLGTHHGLPAYTIGQRSGLGIAAAQPLYVLELDVARNALIVGAADELGRAWLRTGAVNWVAGEPPSGPLRADVQIRYRAHPAPALVTPSDRRHGGSAFCQPLAGHHAGPGRRVLRWRDLPGRRHHRRSCGIADAGA